MPMSSPQMTRMFGLSPSLTAAPPLAREHADHRLRVSIQTPMVGQHHPDRVIWPAIDGRCRGGAAGARSGWCPGRGGQPAYDTKPPDRSSSALEVTCDRRRRSPLSVEGDDDLAVGAALLDVGQRLEGLVKWERLVDDRAEVAGVVERGQFAQLSAVCLHEQERVAHTELPGLLVNLAAQQPHHDAHELRPPELLGEPGVRRASHADRLSTRLEDRKGLLEVFAAE